MKRVLQASRRRLPGSLLAIGLVLLASSSPLKLHAREVSKRRFAGRSFAVSQATETTPARIRSRPATANDQSDIARWEIRTAPLAFLARWYTLDVAYRVTERFATGPTFVSFACGDRGGLFTPCWKGSGFGWTGTYYFGSVLEDSFYVGARGSFDRFTSYPHGISRGYEEINGFRASGVVGWYVPLTRSLQLHVGGGIEQRSYREIEFRGLDPELPVIRGSQRTVSLFGPMIEAKIGFQF